MNQSYRWLTGLSAGTLLFLYGPIVIILVFSFNVSRIATVWEGGTLFWYEQLVGNYSLWLAMGNSLIVGGISTLVSLVLGIGAAVVLERVRVPGQPLKIKFRKHQQTQLSP